MVKCGAGNFRVRVGKHEPKLDSARFDGVLRGDAVIGSQICRVPEVIGRRDQEDVVQHMVICGGHRWTDSEVPAVNAVRLLRRDLEQEVSAQRLCERLSSLYFAGETEFLTFALCSSCAGIRQHQEENEN